MFWESGGGVLQLLFCLALTVLSVSLSQAQLYRHTQPAILLLDFSDSIFLWHGWWPLGSHDLDNINTGSARSRFVEDRKLALETALNYCAGKRSPPSIMCGGVLSLKI